MNRIQNLLDDEVDCSLIPAPLVGTLDTAISEDREHPHFIFTPQHYERNYAYPLIVWLHGPGDDERQVTRVMPLVSLRNYLGVGPRGTFKVANSNGSSTPGYDWQQDSQHIAAAEEHVLSAISAARRWLNVAPHRIFLAGYGSGGTMAFRVALNQPHLFAGVLSIGGALPRTERPFAQIQAARKLNLFLATGRHSQMCPEQEVCDNLRLLHSAGMSINLRQYPCGDDATTDMFSDMDRWIMEQVVAEQPAEHDQPSHPSRGR